MSFRKGSNKGRGAATGPAIMLMPPQIRATFMPNPPLQHVKPLPKRRKTPYSGVFSLLKEFETGSPPQRKPNQNPRILKEEAQKQRKKDVEARMGSKVTDYRNEQKESGGEYEGMNCYNALFVGRLAYEVTERKLLREFEAFGPIKDLKLVKDIQGNGTSAGDGSKSRGYAFIEYEHEEDMKRAYRAADGMKLEGREIVVDVERGHTVPNWLPRRLGGGLGGTRLGGQDKNVTAPGRFDPSRPPMPGPGGMGRGAGPPPMPGGGGAYGRGMPSSQLPPPPSMGYGRGRGMGGGGDRYGGGPPRGGGPSGGGRDRDRGGRYYDRGGGGGGYDSRKRGRSPSPGRRGSHSRRRY